MELPAIPFCGSPLERPHLPLFNQPQRNLAHLFLQRQLLFFEQFEANPDLALLGAQDRGNRALLRHLHGARALSADRKQLASLQAEARELHQQVAKATDRIESGLLTRTAQP
jgi:hypothetical protein